MSPLDRILVGGELSIHPFELVDRPTLIANRDEESRRFLGAGAPEPTPAGVMWVDGEIVGWIDYDTDREWLIEGEVNVGYLVFAEHRGNGYAARALELLCAHLALRSPPLRPTLLIDPANVASLAVARRAGFEAAGAIDGQRLMKLRVG